MSNEPPPLLLDLLIDEDLSQAEVPPQQQLQTWAQAALRDSIASEVCLRVVGDEQARLLNHQYRQRDYATNVLSFPADLPPLPEQRRLLGDLVICAPVVAKEAKQQGKLLVNHWAHLLVHGMLHLQGMDHVDDDDAAEMEEAEVAVLAGFDIADPYREADARIESESP
jgi:probable rRNA maturation factor